MPSARPAQLLGPAVPVGRDGRRLTAVQGYDEQDAVDRRGRGGTRLPDTGHPRAVGADRGRQDVGGGVVEQQLAAPRTRRPGPPASCVGRPRASDTTHSATTVAPSGLTAKAPTGPSRRGGEVPPRDRPVGAHGARQQPLLVRPEIVVPEPHGVRGVQDRADLLLPAGLAAGLVVLVGDGGGQRHRGDDDGARVPCDDGFGDPTRPRAHHVGLARTGSRQSAAGASSAVSLRSGSGRAEVNRRSPSGRNAGAVSPTPLVSLRAGRSPAGSISHSAVRKRVRSGSGAATVVTSRVPSGDRARPAKPGEVLEGLQVAERRHGMSTSLPVVRRACRSSCAFRASSSG